MVCVDAAVRILTSRPLATQIARQNLVTCSWQRIKFWPDDLVFQSLMVSFLMIVQRKLSCGPMKARFPNQNHAVQAGLFNAAHKAFGEGIKIWGSRRQPNRFEARSFEDHPEILAEQAGPIIEQITATL